MEGARDMVDWAIEIGFVDLAALEASSDLELVRKQEDYPKLVSQLKRKRSKAKK